MDDVYYLDLKARLETTPHGERGEVVKSAAEFTGKTEMTIYRHLKKLGYLKTRKPRADKGNSMISDEELRSIAAIKRSTDRANKKKLSSSKLAAEIAHASGLAAKDYHPATVNRRLREAGLSSKQLRRTKPHVTMRTEHPNHMWQIDPSYCVLYYLRDGKSLGVMEESEFYKNKPHNFSKIAKKRILRYVCTDHTTGAFYVYYYNVAGENVETMFDFLMKSMGEKDKQKNPFEGVPRMIYWDLGSANQSYMIQNLLDQLDVAHYAHAQGNSRAKGAVEKCNDIIECNFEARLVFHKITSMTQLNDYAEKWQRYFQSHPKYAHSRHKMTRFQAWRRITREQLIAPPPSQVCRALMTSKPESRAVAGNYQISYEGRQYSLSEVDNISIGTKVSLCVNPWAYPNVRVTHPNRFGEDVTYDIPPLDENEWGYKADSVAVDGTPKSAKDGTIDINRKDIDELAWGTRNEAEIDKLRNRKSKPAFDGQVDALDYLDTIDAANDELRIPRRGEALDVQSPKVKAVDPALAPSLETVTRDEVALPVLSFIKWFAQHHDITPELNKRIRTEYGESGLCESEYEAAAQALTTKLKVG